MQKRGFCFRRADNSALSFGHPGNKQTFQHPFAPGQVFRVVTRCADPEASDSKARIERKSGLRGSTRLVERPKLRQRGCKVEMGEREVAVGLDASPEPGQRFNAFVELNLGHADPQQPPEGENVGGREAKRFKDIGLGLLGSTEKILAETDPAMSVSQIAVKRQRLFAFGNPWQRGP